MYTVRDMMPRIFLDLSIQKDRMFTSGRKIPSSCYKVAGHWLSSNVRPWFTFEDEGDDKVVDMEGGSGYGCGSGKKKQERCYSLQNSDINL